MSINKHCITVDEITLHHRFQLAGHCGADKNIGQHTGDQQIKMVVINAEMWLY